MTRETRITKPLRMKVEARFYVEQMLASGLNPQHDPNHRQLLDLALLGLKVVQERGDGSDLIFFDPKRDYPE